MPDAGALWYLLAPETAIENARIPLKKQWPYFILVFAAPILAVMWWWGLFTTPGLQVVSSQPVRYAYVDYTGPYSQVGDHQHALEFQLQQQGITPLGKITLILDDPRSTPPKQGRARVGYLIAAGATPAAPVTVADLPVRKVVRVTIKGHPLITYGKAYGTLLAYLEQHGMTLRLPTVERYDHSILTVEMPLENAP